MIPFQLHRRVPLLRRPFFQRDRAMEERDQALRERGALAAECGVLGAERDRLAESLENVRRDRDQFRARFIETENHEMPETPFARTPAPAVEVDDTDLVARIIAAYRLSVGTMGGPSESLWEGAFFELKRDVHDALIGGNPADVKRLLRNPEKTDLFYGFEYLARSLPSNTPEHAPYSILAYQDLLLLAEAIGARKLWNPEDARRIPLPEVDTLLDILDPLLGFRVVFPNLFSGEIGLATSRGVCSARAVQALYQTWRITNLLGGALDARIIEIGAGLGRTAFYVRQFGIRDITIIDLPLSAVAQAYFLGRTLGPDAISLFGEHRSGIRILPPTAFLDATDQYDLVVNVDSLTEMSSQTARAYCQAIKSRADAFLSINHEANSFTVGEITASAGMRAANRAPYWLRRGYVEEVFFMRKTISSG